MTPEEILAEAARLVERNWGRGFRRGGTLCAYDAIVTAATDRAEYTTWQVALKAMWHEVKPDTDPGLLVSCVTPASMVGVWNDAPGRTKEEVATALRNAKRWL